MSASVEGLVGFFWFFLINEAKKFIWKSLEDVYPNSKNYWRHIWLIFDIYWCYSLFMNKSIFVSHKIRKKEEKSHGWNKNTKTRKLSFWSLLILTSSSSVYSSSLSCLLVTGFKVEFRSKNISRDFPDFPDHLLTSIFVPLLAADVSLKLTNESCPRLQIHCSLQTAVVRPHTEDCSSLSLSLLQIISSCLHGPVRTKVLMFSNLFFISWILSLI